MMPESNTWILLGLNMDGLLAGLATWATIWGTRYACIKGEYYFKRTFRYVFLAFGVAGVLTALWIDNLVLSAICAIFGFANLWGIHEVIEQEERVNKGWYPRKPEKK
jgi:branched-subunit amino acid transport protein